MDNQDSRIEELLRAMSPITLDEMSEIRLMKRTDQKYLTNIPTLLQLLELTRDSYYSQEIEGHRISPYATTYWDDENDAMFHLHQAGHTPRRKVRVRTYVGSAQSFLEIKRKDNHGKTFKSRVPVPSLDAVINEQAGQDFLEQRAGLSFDDLTPTVGNRFNRITLVNKGKTERLTIDFDIRFFNYKTQATATMDNIVVIELKRDGRVPSPILPLLRKLRIKPSGFSKYCIGAAVTDQTLRVNRFKKRLIKIRKIKEKPVRHTS
ncbi:MAG: polyphosphate polymerase domain-containing protein [Bacteroidales bacterium]|nr:polyphosphate polymerase domain-containing protein [Bacteroidales bacterium]